MLALERKYKTYFNKSYNTDTNILFKSKTQNIIGYDTFYNSILLIICNSSYDELTNFSFNYDYDKINIYTTFTIVKLYYTNNFIFEVNYNYYDEYNFRLWLKEYRNKLLYVYLYMYILNKKFDFNNYNLNNKTYFTNEEVKNNILFKYYNTFKQHLTLINENVTLNENSLFYISYKNSLQFIPVLFYILNKFPKENILINGNFNISLLMKDKNITCYNFDLLKTNLNYKFKLLVITNNITYDEFNVLLNLLDENGLLIIHTHKNESVNLNFNFMVKNVELEDFNIVCIKKLDFMTIRTNIIYNILLRLNRQQIKNFSDKFKINIDDKLIEFNNYTDYDNLFIIEDEHINEIIVGYLKMYESTRLSNFINQKIELNDNDKFVNVNYKIISDNTPNDILKVINNGGIYDNFDLLLCLIMIIYFKNDVEIKKDDYDKALVTINEYNYDPLLQGIELLKSNGLLSLIISNDYMNEYFNSLINSKLNVKEFVNIGNNQTLILFNKKYDIPIIKQPVTIKLNQLFRFISRQGHFTSEIISSGYPLIGSAVNNYGFKGFIKSFDYDGENYQFYTLNIKHGFITRRNYKFSIINDSNYVLLKTLEFDDSILEYINNIISQWIPINLTKFNNIYFNF